MDRESDIGKLDKALDEATAKGGRGRYEERLGRRSIPRPPVIVSYRLKRKLSTFLGRNDGIGANDSRPRNVAGAANASARPKSNQEEPMSYKSRYRARLEPKPRRAGQVPRMARGSWGVLSRTPGLYTRVYHRARYMAKIKPEFDRRNVKIMGISVDSVDDPRLEERQS